MSETFVLVHGAWHTGADFEGVAECLRALGHTVYCPTVRGNNPDDDRSKIGLDDAISSIVELLEEKDLKDVRLIGHSTAGMYISGVADRVEARIRRIVYVNAFVPLPGESLMDMFTPEHRQISGMLASQSNDNSVMLPFVIWRENFMNDSDITFATETYARLNRHPFRTWTDKISLKRSMAEFSIGKSFVNQQQDSSQPHSHTFHPRLSTRLGLFRFVELPGGHETLFTNPARLAQAIVEAARD